ncbi:LOW QUALITY PROTEIN: hypothetical protein MSG28_006715 [Choristoneura fumiferana]|uniref:Uncharacterized protein n=1 Tax=Choristoneura fumiferana TaxID=7141 RepID=A0ACC0JKV3_CHOFU|nr:LOW QUALITY PROTEIN: hypothetical protein MSG28_006715 [Choristoneura fumiferana]
MRKNDDDTTAKEKEKEGCISDWLSGGPMGSKGVVLVFRSCVLASRTPSMESTTKTVGNNTGTTILLNKAKNMARRLVAEPHSFSVRPANIMHDVMETFGNTTKYTGQAYVVRHVSDAEVPETAAIEEQGHEPVEHKRDIEDVLNDLSKITLKKHLNIENTTANIKPPEEPPPPECSKDEKKGKKNKGKNKKKTNSLRNSSPPLDSDDSEHLLIKEVDSVKVLESSHMPARILKITYKLVNTETKLLHRLLQAHGLQEATPEAKDFNLMWSGLHPKPDVLRSLSPYQRVNHFPRRTGLLRALLEAHGLVEATQESEDWNFMWANCMIPFDVLQAMQPHQRVNHFPRSYELTRKDKLFKNIEKMQYFRGLKHFDFIPTTFLMPAEFKELCTTHYRTKGPWIVKPAASSRGRGIYIVNTPEQIPKGENVVVAKYIDKPLLIGGHKCDLRLYVCVTSIDPLLIYLYEEGLVRFATVKYDKTNKNLWNPCMHLCNYSINKYHTDYIKCDDPNAGNIGHKWTLSALLRHLRKQGRNTTALMTAIEDLVVKSVLSSAQTITAAARVFVPNFFNCFDPVSGVPVCSTSLNNNAPYTVVQHNYNLLVHSHVLPHFAHATAAASLTDAPPPHQPDQSLTDAPPPHQPDQRSAPPPLHHHSHVLPHFAHATAAASLTDAPPPHQPDQRSAPPPPPPSLARAAALRARHRRRQPDGRAAAAPARPERPPPLHHHSHVLPHFAHATAAASLTDAPPPHQPDQRSAPPPPPPSLARAAALRARHRRRQPDGRAAAAPARPEVSAPPPPHHHSHVLPHFAHATAAASLTDAPPPHQPDQRSAPPPPLHHHSHVLPHFAHATAAASLTDAPPPHQPDQRSAPPPPPPSLARAAALRARHRRRQPDGRAAAAPARPERPPPLHHHSHVLPHFAHATAAASLTDAPPPHQPDQSMGEGRRAFGLYLTHVLKRVSSFSSELAVAHAGLVLRFLKRASNTLRMPYNVKVTTFKHAACYTLTHTCTA